MASASRVRLSVIAELFVHTGDGLTVAAQAAQKRVCPHGTNATSGRDLLRSQVSVVSVVALTDVGVGPVQSAFSSLSDSLPSATCNASK